MAIALHGVEFEEMAGYLRGSRLKQEERQKWNPGTHSDRLVRALGGCAVSKAQVHREEDEIVGSEIRLLTSLTSSFFNFYLYFHP